MSIASEITRIKNAKESIATSIANKGVTVPDETKIDGYSALIDSITTGGGGGIDGTTGVILNITDIAANQFKDLKGIKKMVLPDVVSIARIAFNNSDVEVIDIGSKIQTINGSAFANAVKLNTLIIRANYSENTLTLTNTPIRNGEGFVYVPDEYVENYKTNVLSNVANQVKPLSEIEGGGIVEIDSITCNATNISGEKFGGDLKAVLADGKTVDIKKIILPNATSFGAYVLGFNSNIEMLDIGSGGANITLNGYTFGDAPKLTTLIFRGWIDTPAGTYNEFEGNSPFLNGTGFLYVPDALLNQYKTSSGWTDIAAQIKPISELEGE